MKKWLLILVGFLPLPLGYLLNWLMFGPMYDKPVGDLLTLYSLGFFLLWYLLGRKLGRWASSPLEATLLIQLPALLDLALILYQEWGMGQYWFNWVGFATQMFYLQTIPIAGIFLRWMSTFTVSPVYIAAFLLMAVLFYLGARRQEQKKYQ